jgi:hypothetical protein
MKREDITLTSALAGGSVLTGPINQGVTRFAGGARVCHWTGDRMRKTPSHPIPLAIWEK